MNRVLSFPQSHSCDNPAEVVSKRFCFSCIFSVSFLSLIFGYLLGARQTQVDVPAFKNFHVNYIDILRSIQHPYNKESNASGRKIGFTNYDEIVMLQEHFKTCKFDEISPILKSSVVLTFKNKDKPDAIEIVVDDEDIRYRNVRNATYRYIFPEEVDEIIHITNNISGLPVYGNFGTDEDFKFLMEQGISLHRCIILLRLGKISLRKKVSEAFKKGVSGVLLFADPQQYPLTDGFSVTEEMSPTLLTDLYKSHGSFGSSCNRSCGVAVQIIESMTARNILKEMAITNKSPDSWHGSLKALYSIGPGFVHQNWRLYMYSYFINVRYTTYDVTAYLRSARNSDRYVLVGTSEKSSGSKETMSESTNALIKVSQTLADMKSKKEWKPARTLVFCSFGLEEIENYSINSWSQKHLKVIQRRTVAYLNIKPPSKGLNQLSVVVSPLLEDLFSNVSSLVANVNNMEDKLSNKKKTLFDIWRQQTEIFGENYNDHSSCEEGNYSALSETKVISELHFDTENTGNKFISRLEIPTISFGYDNQPREPKAITDTESIVNIYDYENSIQVWTLLAFSLSNDFIIPFKITSYSSLLENLNSQLVQHKLLRNSTLIDDIETLNHSVINVTSKMLVFQNIIESFKNHNSLQCRIINDKLMQMEQLFKCIKTSFNSLLNLLNHMLSTEIEPMKILLQRGISCIAEVDYLITNAYY